MITKQLLLALLTASSYALQLKTRDNATDPQATKLIAAANIPKYVAPSLNRDITDWLAVGDSFSAGISADVPNDQMNNYCRRFKQSYPNQMNVNSKFPGHATSRTFVFGSCSGDKMQDLLSNQLSQGTPDLNANHPKIGKPQIGTLSISGNDLGFGNIVNGCLYHWLGWYDDCNVVLKNAHTKLDDPGKTFEYQLISTISNVMAAGRTANSNFQLYVTGYVEFWNDVDTQCNTVSWAARNKDDTYLTTTLRSDMNDLVKKLNNVIKEVVSTIAESAGGVFYVDGWQSKYDGHRFCEHETDPNYHKKPIDAKTWFIHYESPYDNPTSVTGLGSSNGSWFDLVDSILIPPKNGKSTADQLSAVNGNASLINPAYNTPETMTAALTQLATDNATLAMLLITWERIMHPKGAGYEVMSDAVINSVLKFGAAGASTPSPTPSTAPVLQKTCFSSNAHKFMARDDMNTQIGSFCADAAKQGVQDHNMGGLARTYSANSRYKVDLAIDWPSGMDITKNMEANCKSYMTQIMDGCDGNNPANPLDWKHGGTFQVDEVKYTIAPSIDQGYAPGVCAFHLQEDESWSGVDGPGTERHWTYHIEKDDLKDGSGAVIATLGFDSSGQNGVGIEAGASDPLSFNSALPNPLVITPEAQNGDYIQFSIGSQSWTTKDNGAVPGCNTGGWSSDYSPANRNLDCFFNC